MGLIPHRLWLKTKLYLELLNIDLGCSQLCYILQSNLWQRIKGSSPHTSPLPLNLSVLHQFTPESSNCCRQGLSESKKLQKRWKTGKTTLSQQYFRIMKCKRYCYYKNLKYKINHENLLNIWTMKKNKSKQRLTWFNTSVMYSKSQFCSQTKCTNKMLCICYTHYFLCVTAYFEPHDIKLHAYNYSHLPYFPT